MNSMKLASIRQNPAGHSPQPLPDARNLGVLLRVLLGVNALAVGYALLGGADWRLWLDGLLAAAVWVEPLLAINLALIALLREPLRRLPPRLAQALLLLLVMASAVLLAHAWFAFGLLDAPAGWRAALLSGGVAVLVLGYFDLRAHALPPALIEARLQALTARIRPHFLFNSLNAVLSLIRDDPRRAETALENLADLFRVLLRNDRSLAPLAEEIALCRQYLDIEKLRLGERLQVEWLIDEVPDDTLLPTLMLQPLLENAIYHGVEACEQAAPVSVSFTRDGSQLLIALDNPCPPDNSKHPGNRMALANIRERLALTYDLEASLVAEERDGHYRVRIALPLQRGGGA